MNNKIYIVDRNGNQVIVEGIAYIELKGDGFANEYLFYTLNEIVNGDLNKIYVAKVNNDNLTIDDAEWENIKAAMRAITHQEQVEGLTYLNMFDEKGEVKVFKTEIPRKLALKLDNLTGIIDTYKIAISNPGNKSDTAAVGGQFIDPELLVDKGNEKSIDNTNTPSAFDGSIKPSVPEAIPQVQEVAPVAPVVPPAAPVQEPALVASAPTQAPAAPVQEVQPAVDAPAVAPVQPVVATPQVQTVQAPVVELPTVPVQTEEPKEETNPFEEIKAIAPTPIPEVLKEDSFAIPVSTPPVQTTSGTSTIEDNDIFNEIIKELSEIKNQNKEIQESIRKLQNNIANINTNLSQQEITNSQGSYDGMINTNMANTTEDVAAIDITSNGAVVIPSFEQAQQTAQQTASVISTNVLEPSNNVIDTSVNTTINTVPISDVIEQPTQAVITQPVDLPAPVIEQPVSPAPVSVPVPEAPTVPVVETPVAPVQEPAPVAPVQPVAPAPVQVAQPAVIEQPTAVTEVPELPQIIPDVPMASDTPNIIMPNGDPLADLPPVQMPMGVSAGDDSSAVGSTITGI
ncbi:MAG: hypothetical protein K6E99_03465 [Bacilli bacterium]|nr:hypothetical protein [Bacilli bacterium]